MRAICSLIFAFAWWPLSAFARPYQDSDYHLFESEQMAAMAALPHGWKFERRAPIQQYGFLGITLTFRGPRTIYDPAIAETLPILPRLKPGGREEVTLTLWPANYEPHRANLFSHLRYLGMDADAPDPVAGNTRVKITASADFNANTTPSSWPTWREDLIKAMRLTPIPPSARQIQLSQDQSRPDGNILGTPEIAIHWAEAGMRKAGFFPTSKPYVRQHPTSFIVFWPHTGGFDAILIVSKTTHRSQYFVFGGGLKTK